MRLSKKYFSDKELGCRHCGVVRINPIFDGKLLLLREALGAPMKVNSCCRCATHNKNVGGATRSFHLCDDTGFKTNGTCAIDIARKGGAYDIKLVLAAWDAGWRVGVHPTFFHFDCAPDVTGRPQIIFSYGKTDPKDLARWKRLVG